jgi:hypothetical protein
MSHLRLRVQKVHRTRSVKNLVPISTSFLEVESITTKPRSYSDQQISTVIRKAKKSVLGIKASCESPPPRRLVRLAKIDEL